MSEFRKFTPKSVARVVTPLFIFTSSLVLSGCPERQISQQQPDYCSGEPNSVVPPQMANKELKAIHRASSLQIFNSNYSGTASLVNQDGRLYIYTIKHVADLSQGKERACVLFPGMDFLGLLDSKKFQYHPKQINNDDVIVSYKINEDTSAKLKKIIDEGVIKPLVVSKNTPKPRSELVIPRPDTGLYTYMVYVGKSPVGFLNLVFNMGDTICAGRSGGPVLEVQSGGPTNRMIGIISSVDKKYKMPDPSGNSYNCSAVALAVPIN